MIDEFITIETQYYKLRGKIEFIPFLESFLGRVDKFARTNLATTASIEHKKALADLNTAILSKFNSIQNNGNQNTAFDLEKFLDEVENNILQLNESIAENSNNRSDRI